MARMQYVDTVAIAALVDGDLDAAAGVQIDIYQRGTTTHAQVYTTEGGGTAFANPFTTPASGLVSFWADFGKYDIRYTDTNPSPRFSAWTKGWDSTPYDNLVGTVPTGIVIPTAMRRAPAGWLLCDGSEISRTTYARLWDALRTDASGTLTSSSPYGNGNGASTFNLPDLRGRAPVGPDGAAGRLSANDTAGASGGTETHTLTTAEIPSHAHATPASTFYSGVAAGAVTAAAGVDYGLTENRVGPSALTGGGGAHNNMPPYLVTNFIIKD